MKIYSHEILDGLEQEIEKQNSIALICPILEFNKFEGEIADNLKTAIAKLDSSKNQIDLYDLSAILASTGWNGNYDIFLPEELWAAKDSPCDKPFNYMHDSSEIIGHITGSEAFDQEGNLLTEMPDKDFDVVISSVLYKWWNRNFDKQELVDQLIQEIEASKQAVSMECLFPDFDYAISMNGVDKIIKRNETSAFLSKYLRSYGGTGEYQGNKIGRVLRQITFSGVGLVKTPANQRSQIILQATASLEEISMADTQELETKVTELEATVAKLTETVAQLTDSLAATATELESAIAEKNTILTESKQLKQDLKNITRKGLLAEANIPADQIDKTIKDFESADDNVFKATIALLKTRPLSATLESTVEDEVDEVLDEVEQTSASVVDEDAGSDINRAVASAAQYLKNNVLKSTRKGK